MLAQPPGQPSQFLAPFRDFFAKATDAPLNYGEAAGLMALSSIAIGRRTLAVGNGINPNLYMMLVGKSSVARKSTSVRYSLDAIKLIESERIGPRDFTPEALMKWMSAPNSAGQPRRCVSLFSEEFGMDLSRMQSYNTSYQADFCALYDGSTFDKIRVTSKPITVTDPRVSLFAASAYSMLKTHLKSKDWQTGFLMRFMFVAPDELREPYSIQPEFPLPEWQQAIYGLTLIWDTLCKYSAPMTIEPSARAIYETGARSLANFVADKEMDIIHTYTNRFGVNVLKLAMLYQLDIDQWSPISDFAMMKALEFAGNVCWPSFDILTKEMMSDEWDMLFPQVVNAVRDSGGTIKKVDLFMKFEGNRLLPDIVKHMLSGGLFLPGMGPTGDQFLRLAPIYKKVTK